MKFILFLMFFIAPPAPRDAPEPKVWTLQSTSTMDFTSFKACHEVGSAITKSVRETDTVTLRGWCFCEGPGSSCDGDMKTYSFPDGETSEPSVGIRKLNPRGE